MPRLPKYFLTRHGVYYVRKWHKGQMAWKAFGKNRPEAIRLGTLWLQRLACERRPDTRPNVRNLIRDWLLATGRNPHAKRNATWRLEHHVIPALGSVSAGDLTPAMLHALRNDLATKLSPESVRNVLADFRTVLRFHLGPAAPAFDGVLPRTEEREPDRLTDEAVDLILTHARDPWRWAILLSLETGIRWGELAALEWHHVNWARKCLVVEAGKTGKVRRIPLSPAMVDLLTRERFAGRDTVFPRRTQAHGAVERIGKRAGITWHFHQLRHTFACRWIEKGGTLKALSQLMGHASVRTTERYAKLSEAAVFAEVERLALADSLKTCSKNQSIEGTTKEASA
jgi:integrase